MATNTQPQPDLQALALTKAIRQQETGGNYSASGDAGTSTGAYQFQPATWKAFSGQILGNANAPMTPENQNAVAYGMIKTWKDSGMGPAEIAAKWNSGSETGWENKIGTTTINGKQIPYNVPQYVQGVVSNFKQIYPTLQSQYGAPQPGGLIPTANADVSGQAPVESPSVSGFVGNIFKSAGNLAAGLGQAVMHPVDTVKNIAGIAAGAVENTINHPINALTFGAPILQKYGPDTHLIDDNNPDLQTFNNTVSYFKNRYGGDSLSEVAGHIGNTLYTDPVGAALDLSTLIDGVGAAVGTASKISKVSELGKASELLKQASEMVNPIAQGAKIARPLVNTGVAATRSIASHLFSLSDPASITRVLEDPAAFSKAATETTNRASLAEDFGQALDQLHGAVQEGGAAYKGIAASEVPIRVPENWITDVLAKGSSAAEADRAIPFGLKLETDPATGRMIVSADTKSFTRDPRDIAAVQQFVDMWGNKSELTPQEFLNMRSDLSKMSKFGRDIGKNDAAELIAKALRADANKTMRPSIGGLKTLDENQAPIIQQYNQAKKDFLTVSPAGGYEFKPGAINKIANATGKGKDILLQRMEQISPGVTKRIQILKAIEDWESASKAKVGSYARGIIEGGGVVTGNMPAIAAAIISNPAVALPILRGLGWSAAKMKPLLDLLKKVVNTSNLKYPAEAGTISNNVQPKPSPQKP